VGGNEKFVALIALLYGIGFSLPLAMPNSYFWDDWLNYFKKTAIEVRSSEGPFSGFSPLRLVAEGWLAENWGFGFRILTFLLFPIAAWGLFQALRGSRYLNQSEILVLTAVFLLAPVNSARYSMTIFMYTSCYASFFVGWWLFAQGKSRLIRLLALIFFLNSFDTASLLFFMSIPLLHSILNQDLALSSIIRWVRRNWYFAVAPIGYWFIEPALNPTLDQVREDYYTPKLSGIMRGLVLLVGISLAVAFFWAKRKWRYESDRGKIQLSLGVFVLWIGMFPYMTLGHFPNLESILIGFVPGQSDWDSRHQLLMPLGLSFVVIGALNLTNSKRLLQAVVPILLMFTVLNFTFSQEYYLDSIKTHAIVEALEHADEIGGYKFVLIDDQALRFNARGRRIRSYEWDAMMFAAKGASAPKTDVYRYVDCAAVRPEAIVTITASRGKLATLLTRDPVITFSTREIRLCN